MAFSEIVGISTLMYAVLIAVIILEFIDNGGFSLTTSEERKIYEEEYEGPYYVKVELTNGNSVIMGLEHDTVNIFGDNSLYSDTGFLQYIIKKFEIMHSYKEDISTITLDYGLMLYFDIEEGLVYDVRSTRMGEEETYGE